MNKKFFRHLHWTTPSNRPWVCYWDEDFGSRPIKDATMRRLIKKGYFPFDKEKMINKGYKNG